MKRIALALVATVAFVVAPATAADARPADPQSDCVVAAMSVGDFQAALACDDDGGASTNSRSRNIDWD